LVENIFNAITGLYMQPIQTAITGQENTGDLSSPYQALVQFYCAFNTGDMDMMSKNWAQSDEIAMNNPLGGIKRGWVEIQPVYERIFKGEAKVYVEYFDYTMHETTEMFYAIGRERGYFQLGDEDITLAIRTSRIFRKIDGRWQQVHHHGSIEDSKLLDRYQAAVLGKPSRI
jgi:ketosteroid isomerase-like protein